MNNRQQATGRACAVALASLAAALLLAWNAQAATAAPEAAASGVLASGAAAPGAAQPTLAQAVTAATAAAPGVNLRLTYESRTIGTDGVERDSRYTDLMFRRPGAVWVERELPAPLRESAAHGHKHPPGPHAGHGHEEAQGAPLLVRRDDQGNVAVQLVLHEQRRVIDVDLAHHGNVGYGGSWPSAYWLIDPASLAGMAPLGAPRDGVQHYRLVQGERTVRVDWDVANHYARRIEQDTGHGLSSQRMIATPFPAPAQLPWDTLGDYSSGDYSDLLD